MVSSEAVPSSNGRQNTVRDVTENGTVYNSRNGFQASGGARRLRKDGAVSFESGRPVGTDQFINVFVRCAVCSGEYFIFK